jgi:hypothetical protein
VKSEQKITALGWYRNTVQRSPARLKEDSFSGIIGGDLEMKGILI